MLLTCHPREIPFKHPLTNSDHRHVHYRVEYLLQASWIPLLFSLQVTKNERQVMKPLYDRYRLVKQILSRANTIPIIVSRAFFWGLFLWFQAEERGITTYLHTTQSVRPGPNLPYHSKTKQMSESMTHHILRSGKAGQGTLVPTCEPWGTCHLVLFLLFPLGCWCYFIILCLATASLPFPYQSTLSCRSSMPLGYTALYVRNTDLRGSHRRYQTPWLRKRSNSLLTLHLHERDPTNSWMFPHSRWCFGKEALPPARNLTHPLREQMHYL